MIYCLLHKRQSFLFYSHYNIKSFQK